MENLTVKNIDIILPIEPETVRILRLTLSGVANMMGFHIDDIEDLKVSAAEVCNQLITEHPKCLQNRMMISFQNHINRLNITFSFEGQRPEGFVLFKEETLALSIINTLMDEVIIPTDGTEFFTLCMDLKEN